MGRRPKKRGRDVHGVVLVDKPLGLSSNQVLQRVKRLFNANRAGHTGTLDPMATGLLPICLGEATKVAAFLTDADKSYEAVLQLGQQTNTADKEGEVVNTIPVPPDWQSNVEAVLSTLIGQHQQVPPMFSAIKVNGQPLYKAARAGVEVERKARDITVYDLRLLNIDEETQQIRFVVDCSKGTYVRTLGETIAEALGTCGHLSELRRVKVLPYDHDKMRVFEEYERLANEGDFEQLDATLLPVDTVLVDWEQLELDPELRTRLFNGQRIRLFAEEESTPDRHVKIYSNSEFLGMGELRNGVLHPLRLMKY